MNLHTARSIAAPLALLVAAGLAAGQNTERAAVPNGFNNAPSWGHSLAGYTTPDGRWTVFSSEAYNLVANDNNNKWDVFVRDRWTNATVRVSVPNPGFALESNGDSFLANPGSRTISDDGRFVVFQTVANNLIVGDANAASDIYVHDRDFDANGIYDEPGQGKTRTTRVSLATDGTAASGQCSGQICPHASMGGVISADGRYVAWTSGYNFTSEIVAHRNVYWRDRDTDNDGVFDEPGAVVTRLVSARHNDFFAGQIGDADSGDPALSADGRWVVFESLSRHIVPNDPTANREVFARDMLALTPSVRLSAPQGAPADAQPDGVAYEPSVSASGRFVAFTTSAANLGPTVNPFVTSILVKDRDADGNGVFDEPAGVAFHNVSKFRASLGIDVSFTLLNGPSYTPMISDDGRFVSFGSASTNFSTCLASIGQDPGPWCHDSTPNLNEVFVFDRLTGLPNVGQLRRASLTRGNLEPNAHTGTPTISPNGRWVTFLSAASNIDFNDLSDDADPFVRVMSPPPHATCATARPIVLGSITHAETYGSAPEGQGGCNGDQSPSVWFTFTAPCTGTAEINTFGSPFDTVLAVFQGECPATADKLVACNDDYELNSMAAFWSRLYLPLIAGERYLVRVSGYGTDGGHVVLTALPCVPTPCVADFNGDGNLDPDDLGDFINCYFATPPCRLADFNADGNIDPDDLGDFINAYFAGCP